MLSCSLSASLLLTHDHDISWYSFLLSQDVIVEFFSRHMLQISTGWHINETYYSCFPWCLHPFETISEPIFSSEPSSITVLKIKVLHTIQSAREVL